MRFRKVKNNGLPKNNGFAKDRETSSKTPWFYKLEIVHSIFYYQDRFGNQTYVLSKVKLAAHNQFWKTIKERAKFKGSKRRFHNVVKTEGSRKSQTNVRRVLRLKWTSHSLDMPGTYIISSLYHLYIDFSQVISVSKMNTISNNNNTFQGFVSSNKRKYRFTNRTISSIWVYGNETYD